MKLVKQVCKTCGSTDVLCDAYASWDVRTQEWVLDNCFDKGAFCSACDGETRIIEKPLDPKEDAEELREARAHHLAMCHGWEPGDSETAIEFCDDNDLDFEKPSAEITDDEI